MNKLSARVLAIVVACGSVGLLLTTSAAAADLRHADVPSQNVITIPSPDKVSNSVDASRCPWLTAYVSQVSRTIGSSSMAMLLAAPVIASEYGMVGN